MNTTGTLEILAPAGSYDSLVAAVRCGANAVYLGSKALNARRNAANFDDEELARAVSYCHERGVKVYQTLNTVMFDEETDEVVAAIETAARLGVDALLVQDLGVAKMVKACAPDLPIHASTQMAVHNLAGVLEAQALGCQRVVLARELSKEEIRYINEHTDVETEIFVHGALCMCVSGQCYLSSMIGERSGNRGLCAQPCRLPFQAKGGAEYGLSLKDLTLADRMAELRDSGVHALKIEGRMKRPEYGAAAVTAVKNAVEGRPVDFDALRSVFSRSGFTTGYFDDKIDKTMFGVRQKEDVVSAQGVLGDLAKLYGKEAPRVRVDFDFQLEAGEPAALAARDEDGNAAFAQGDVPQIAENKPTTQEKVAQSLAKTGGTPYYLGELTADIGEGLILPVSALNAMRRQVLEEIGEKRSALHPVPFQDVVPRNHPKLLNIKIPALRARVLTAAQLSPLMLEQCEQIAMPVDALLAALEAGAIPCPEKMAVEIPRILFGPADSTQEKLGRLKQKGITKAWAGNLGAVRLAREAGLEIHGGFSLNLNNSHALKAAAELGLKDAELSFEINLFKAKKLGDYLPYGILAYGYFPLMALRNCPIKAAMGCKACGRKWNTLTDRKGVEFMVDCGSGISELFNSVPVYLADRKEELEGFSFLTLYFTCEDGKTCERIVREYAFGGRPEGDKTRGLYYRNVL